MPQSSSVDSTPCLLLPHFPGAGLLVLRGWQIIASTSPTSASVISRFFFHVLSRRFAGEIGQREQTEELVRFIDDR